MSAKLPLKLKLTHSPGLTPLGPTGLLESAPKSALKLMVLPPGTFVGLAPQEKLTPLPLSEMLPGVSAAPAFSQSK